MKNHESSYFRLDSNGFNSSKTYHVVFWFLEPRSDLYNKKHLNFSNAIEYKKSCMSRKCIKMHENTIVYHEKHIEHFCYFYTRFKHRFR